MASLTLHAILHPRGPAAAIVLTDEQVEQLGGGLRAPVRVTIGGRSAAVRLGRMGGENLVGLSKANRAALGVEIGDEVDVEIALDDVPREVDVPSELAEALEAAGLRAAWDALAPSRRKEHARSVAEAKQDATRERRIAKVVESLQA